VYPEIPWAIVKPTVKSKSSTARVTFDGSDRPLKRPRGFWSGNNQRLFFDTVAKDLKVQQPEDWYKVNVEDVVQKGGTFISHLYNGSLIKGTDKSKRSLTQ
jgi:hypothetical protein